MRKNPFVAYLLLGIAMFILRPGTTAGQHPASASQPTKQGTFFEVGADGKILLRAANGPFGVLRHLLLERNAGNNCLGGTLPDGLPKWFYDFDTDEDGQISHVEWRRTDKKIADFRLLDFNDDGFITADELLRYLRRPIALKLDNGRASYDGAIEASDQKYLGRKFAKIITINFVAGQTYQIDHTSKSFDAFLYLEDADGERLAEDDDGGGGLNARIVFRAAQSGAYRVIATSVGNGRFGVFSLSIRLLNRNGGFLPKGIPSWFKDLDTDEDGQVALHEWRAGGKKLGEFRELDHNDDGFATAEEFLRYEKRKSDLKLEAGQANFQGSIEEPADEQYRGKRSFKILTVKLERGKTYQFDHISKVFQAFVYLEDADGDLLMENSSRSIGENSRIVFRASRTGTYRLVATSLGGFRTGAFLFSVRIINGFGGVLPNGIPPWFRTFDKDQDGQVSLDEWRAGGMKTFDFRAFDSNDDGFVTMEEAIRTATNASELEFQKGEVNYAGAMDEPEEKYRDKKAYKILKIRLEQGKTYQIDCISQAYYAYLFLEDPDGNVIDRHNSGGRGLISRIVFTAVETGSYRIIATSQDGYKTGDFSLSVRATNAR